MDLLLTGALSIVLAPLLAVAFARLAEGRAPALPRSLGAIWGSAGGLAAATSLLLSAAALALLPWPLHPARAHPLVGHPAALWSAVEGAFLIPLLPALLAPSQLAARAASREGQISLAGRFVVWLSLGLALWSGAGWSLADIVGRVLGVLAALAALPAAAGVGPFAAETSLNPGGAEELLDEDTARLIRLSRAARSAVLLAALVVASLPLAAVAAPVGLLLCLAVFVVVPLGIRRAGANQPRTTLPAAIRWCLWRALPLAAMGIVYLIIV